MHSEPPRYEVREVTTNLRRSPQFESGGYREHYCMTFVGKFHQIFCEPDVVTIRVGTKLPVITMGYRISNSSVIMNELTMPVVPSCHVPDEQT